MSRRRSPAFCWSSPAKRAPLPIPSLIATNYAVQLDLIFAKAQVAYKMKAVVPQIGEDGENHSPRRPGTP